MPCRPPREHKPKCDVYDQLALALDASRLKLNALRDDREKEINRNNYHWIAFFAWSGIFSLFAAIYLKTPFWLMCGIFGPWLVLKLSTEYQIIRYKDELEQYLKMKHQLWDLHSTSVQLMEAKKTPSNYTQFLLFSLERKFEQLNLV